MPERDESGLKSLGAIQNLEPDPSRITLPIARRDEMDTAPRSGTGSLLPTLETRERDREVYRLRIHVGLTFQEIADQLGYADPSGPAHAFKRVLDAVPRQISEDARNAEIAHLEMLRARLLALLDKDYYTVQQGKVIFDPLSPVSQPLKDTGPVLAAIDRLVKIEERIAKLQNLENQGPAVVVANVNYSIEGVNMDALK